MSDSLRDKIAELKRQRGAVILVHNYQPAEVQEVADFTGDSLQLSRQAAKTDAAVIVFCGVHFMAETAAILSPDKTVLMPDPLAGCPMADMITADGLRKLKAKHPGAVVVCYVNSSAEVKAESDCCCTSANAVAVVKAIDAGKEIIFVPDKYLGEYVSEQTGRKMVLWPGYCPIHVLITEEDVLAAKKAHRGAFVMVHPECTGPVRGLADAVLSTGGMRRRAAESNAAEFIVGTEVGMLYRLAKDNPGKRFYPATQDAVCPNMKRTTLEKVLWSLEDMEYRITVPAEIASRARGAIDRMLAITG